LADGRWGYAERRGRATEIAVLGDGQKRLHVVKGTLLDCKVLLHDP